MNEEFIKRLLDLYPVYDKVNGPYKRKDGRKHIVLNNSKLPAKTKGKLKTISWPKALVEVRENKLLLDNETVDHDDQDFTNDSLDNLIIRDRVEHIKLDARRRTELETNCIWCGTKFVLTRHQYGKAKGKAGPFCSKSCIAKYSTSIQNGGKSLLRNVVKKEYFTNKTE